MKGSGVGGVAGHFSTSGTAEGFIARQLCPHDPVDTRSATNGGYTVGVILASDELINIRRRNFHMTRCV